MAKLPWQEINAITDRAGFDLPSLRLAQIWAAKHRLCPKCGAGPYQACRNMNGVANFGFDLARENVYPHPARIDYDKLKKALNDKGYW